MMNNAVLMDCRVPPHVADVVFVVSWLVQENGFPDFELHSLPTLGPGWFCMTSLQAALVLFQPIITTLS
jgi:hypothetical protein